MNDPENLPAPVPAPFTLDDFFAGLRAVGYAVNEAWQNFISLIQPAARNLSRILSNLAKADLLPPPPRHKRNPGARLHHELDAYSWITKAETVRKVAENLEITLPAEEAAAPALGSTPLSGFHSHIYLDGLEIFSAKAATVETEQPDGQP